MRLTTTYPSKTASSTIVYSEVPSANQETRLLDTDKQNIEESSSSMNIRCLVELHKVYHCDDTMLLTASPMLNHS